MLTPKHVYLGFRTMAQGCLAQNAHLFAQIKFTFRILFVAELKTRHGATVLAEHSRAMARELNLHTDVNKNIDRNLPPNPCPIASVCCETAIQR